MTKELKKWMPMFWPEYLADTGHFNAAEHGAYMLLIAHYWMTGGIPHTNDELLRRITRMTPRQWRLSRDVVMSKFGDDGRHKRVDEELAYAIEKSRRLSANAKLRLSNGKPVADTPTPTPTKKEERYVFESGVIRLNERDFNRWKSAYSNLDLEAELCGLAGWAAEQKSWFNAVAGALAKKNRTATKPSSGVIALRRMGIV